MGTAHIYKRMRRLGQRPWGLVTRPSARLRFLVVEASEADALLVQWPAIASALSPAPLGIFPGPSIGVPGKPSERVSLPPSDLSRLLKLNELEFPEAIALLVNALRLAIRRITRNGAMACPLFWLESHVHGHGTSGKHRNGTNLSFDEDWEEDVRHPTVGTPRPNKQ